MMFDTHAYYGQPGLAPWQLAPQGLYGFIPGPYGQAQGQGQQLPGFGLQGFGPPGLAQQVLGPLTFGPQAFAPQAFGSPAGGVPGLGSHGIGLQGFGPPAFGPQAYAPQGWGSQMFGPQGLPGTNPQGYGPPLGQPFAGWPSQIAACAPQSILAALFAQHALGIPPTFGGLPPFGHAGPQALYGGPQAMYGSPLAHQMGAWPGQGQTGGLLANGQFGAGFGRLPFQVPQQLAYTG
jgi:hypothetical protein